MEDPKGLYASLGVSRTADQVEIKKAYRRQALQTHPDKNPDDPDAKAKFQKICQAYEVLSEESRREMYDRTGCVDEEELEATDLDHAEEFFNFFFQDFHDGLDMEEQFFVQELLRMDEGMFTRPRGPRSRRKGAKKGKAGAAHSKMMEEQFLQEMFSAMGAFGGGLSSSAAAPQAMVCPEAHPLKKRKSEDEYECDMCQRDIATGKKFYDCRQCNYSICLKCFRKHASKQAADEEEDEEVDVFLDQLLRMSQGR
mmetsp:Transcript_25655/g.59304  ORF Transcript_25655/g.59304 Transcript_25655/m.59304 type:complete len:254 (-) Transcript_25655:27-788(-)